MKKNEIYEGIITAYGSEGEGIIKSDGYVIFVPFTVLNEKIRYRVLKVDKNIVYAKVESILAPSEKRRVPGCPVFGKCGGCRLLHMDYAEQLDYKRTLIAHTLKKIAFLDIAVGETVPSVPELRYRNKLQLPLRHVNGRNVCGFFAPDSHRIVETDDCLIQGDWCAGVIKAIKEFAEIYKLDFYDESADNGLIRHLIVKKVCEWFLVSVVINGSNLPHSAELFELLKKHLYTQSITLTLNENRGRGNAVLGEKTRVLFGSGVIKGEQFGVKYTVGTHDFIQINDSVKQSLYSDAVGFACENSPSLVIDAYCGGGLMTALLAAKAKKVIGVEIVREAVDNAEKLIKDNDILNATFICGLSEIVLPDIVKQADGDCAVVLDPPRKGVDKRLIEALLSSNVKKIVYVSCNPATLSRDAGLLCGTLHYDGEKLLKSQRTADGQSTENTCGGNYFKIKSLKGYDMFADCKGVECLCVFER